MSDEELRELERRARLDGDPGHLLHARLRSGLPAVRPDGLYRCAPRPIEAGGACSGWLRFYPDGAVLSVSTTLNATPADLARWFRRERAAGSWFSSGSWVVEGERIAFDSTSPEGVVDYEGRIEGDQLHLSVHSRINDHRCEEVYTFVPAEL